MEKIGRDANQPTSPQKSRIRPLIWRTVLIPNILAGLFFGISIALLLDILFIRPAILQNDNISAEFTNTLRIILTTLTIAPSTLFMIIIAERSANSYNRLLNSAQALISQTNTVDHGHSTKSSTAEVEIIATQLDQLEGQLQLAEKNKMLLQRYLGTEIAQHILTHSHSPGGKMTQATVLFCDIRKFTKWMEQADVEELFDELNEYFAMIQSAIGKHGGVINKFGGDSVLALFGVPLTLTNHSFQAIRAAVSITDELAILNEKRRIAGRPPFDIGIGVNTGEMIVGNLGSEDRLEYTVIGDCVNGAKRLSDLNASEENPFPFHSIFVSDSCMSNVTTVPDEWEVSGIKEVYVTGRNNPIKTHAIIPLG